MALSYIGSAVNSYRPNTRSPKFFSKIINLTSAHDVRYRGVLAGIDPVQHTIQLSNGEGSAFDCDICTDHTAIKCTPWAQKTGGEHRPSIPSTHDEHRGYLEL
jgi:hypothetical protein